jgi:hypothetical protein
VAKNDEPTVNVVNDNKTTYMPENIQAAVELTTPSLSLTYYIRSGLCKLAHQLGVKGSVDEKLKRKVCCRIF